MNKIKTDKRFYIAIMLTLIISVSLTLGFTMAFFGDKKDGDTDVTLGASIYFDGERGVALTTSKTSAVVPGETVEVEATFVVKSGEGTAIPAVLKVEPKVIFSEVEAYLSFSTGDTLPVSIDDSELTDAVMVANNGSLYLVNASDNSALYSFTPTNSGTTISFKIPVKFPLSIDGSASGKSCNVTATATVLQSRIYTDDNVLVPCTIADFAPYWDTACIYEWSEDGKYIYFGSYPQTIKKSGVLVSSIVDDDGYYIGSDGEKYAKITANMYGTGSEYKASDGTQMTTGVTYYFKVEPLKWRMLYNAGDKDYLIVCDNIITAMAYQPNYNSSYYVLDDNGNVITDGGKNVYANNYKWSKLRSFLNGDFYDVAFTPAQKQLIKTTNVDNSLASTGYASSNAYLCKNTVDKVFVLSKADATNANYGFSTDRNEEDSNRTWSSSDYVKANGLYVDSSNYNSFVWLRTPSDTTGRNVCYVYGGGSLNYNGVFRTYYGVVPALNLSL